MRHVESQRSATLILLASVLAFGCGEATIAQSSPTLPSPATAKSPEPVQTTNPDLIRIDRALGNLKSTEASIRQEAIRELSSWGAGELKNRQIATALFQRLENNVGGGVGYDVSYEHHVHGDRATTVVIPAENVALAEALAASRVTKALPLLMQAQARIMGEVEDERSETSSRSLASSIYRLSAKRVVYWQTSEGTVATYEPSPIEEESTRLVLRPDLEPLGGMTASLRLEAQHADSQIRGSMSLRATLELKNHSEDVLKVDLSPKNFTFSIVIGGQRYSLPASKLPTPVMALATVEIAPQQSVKVVWAIDSVVHSALHDLFGTGGFYVHVKHAPTGLVSNTIESYYFGRE